MKWTLCLLLLASGAKAMPTEEKTGRAFSLFSVVTFPNSECTTSMTPPMNGICVTAEECKNEGNVEATASGNCASGFGVCCFKNINTYPAAVTKDLTHITNAEFPMPVTALVAAPVTPTARVVNIAGQGNVCAIKLEFLNVVLNNPVGGTCGDSITVTTPARTAANAGFVPGPLCGLLTGQHMFVDVVPGGNAMAAVLNINTDGTAGNRMWKIRVRCVECTDPNRPTPGCLQWFTGLSGRVMSFNAPRADGLQQQLINQQYTVCIRRQAGMCGVMWRESDPAAMPILSFLIGGAPLNAGGMLVTGVGLAATGGFCGGQFITISPIGEICGGFLAEVPLSTAPGTVFGDSFTLGVTNDATATAPMSGFDLLFSQTPCQ